MRTLLRLTYKYFILLWAINIAPLPSQAIDLTKEGINNPELVSTLIKGKGNFWTNNNSTSATLRSAILQLIDRSDYKGLDKSRYHYEILHSFTDRNELSIDELHNYEAFFTDAAISYCKDLVKAPEPNTWVRYDEVSGKYKKTEDENLLHALSSVNNSEDLQRVIATTEPSNNAYNKLISELASQIASDHAINIRKTAITLAYHRWIHHFKFAKCIVVNIASATLYYYENNQLKLNMKVVVGKPSTKTPRFAAYCNEVILYPYWHVPRSIAVKEILPRCKKSSAVISALNLQVLNSKGNIINPKSINWKAYNSTNFPYTFRQSTGCGNSLGVIKFNITDPFSVYLHDTNFKSAFNSNKRYLSHGCIRVEKPVDLANYILRNKLDTNFIAACVKDQKPVSLPISPVPVFVTYMPVEVSPSDTIIYYDDIYKLL